MKVILLSLLILLCSPTSVSGFMPENDNGKPKEESVQSAGSRVFNDVSNEALRG